MLLPCIAQITQTGLNEDDQRSSQMLTIGTERQTSTLKDFLWLAGCRNSSPVFFHWRNEWILSEFILLGPLAAAATSFVNLIYQSFHFNWGEGWIFRNKSLWFPSRLCDPALLQSNIWAQNQPVSLIRRVRVCVIFSRWFAFIGVVSVCWIQITVTIFSLCVSRTAWLSLKLSASHVFYKKEPLVPRHEGDLTPPSQSRCHKSRILLQMSWKWSVPEQSVS